MKIELIGSVRGYPHSRASAEDIAREFGPRFLRDGHNFTIHIWATDESKSKRIKSDYYNGIKRVFHTTPGGKISGQFFVALKASIYASFSDCDIVLYLWINNSIFSWIPKLFNKKIFINLDGMMWKDPKWPWGIRYLFFIFGAYLSKLLGDKVITDSYNMQLIYKKQFKIDVDWIGYGCTSTIPQKKEIELSKKYPLGYYLIMSRITPHNLTDLMVDGFINSKSKSNLIIAGEIPLNKWFLDLKKRSINKNVIFLGIVKDQDELNQIILNSRAYLHGHSLGGINPALVRLAGMDKPVICIDTAFNREVVEYPNRRLQAFVFRKNVNSVAEAINKFEKREEYYIKEAKLLGEKIRATMSWEIIYQKYKNILKSCFL